MSSNLLDLMWQATRERYGLIVETDKPVRLRQMFYAIRRAHMTDFANIKLTIAGDRVWILNKEGTDDPSD